jgi:hypothetical protein
MPASALARSISHVLRVRSKKQMRRIHAPSVIASMQNKLPVFDVLDEHFIGDPMRQLHLAADEELSVSTAAAGRPPDPAFVF